MSLTTIARTQTSANRINWISILQGWAMLWVVIGHSVLPDNQAFVQWGGVIANVGFDIAYSFHMPLFIFVSGYLFYLTCINTTKTYWSVMKSKLIRLGIPYVVFTVVSLLLKDVFAVYMSRPSDFSVMGYVNALVHPNDGPMREFWFIAVIMWLFTLMPLWKLILQNKYVSVIVLLCLYALLFVPKIPIDFLCVECVPRYVFYFFAGIMLCKYIKAQELIKRNKVLILICGVCLWGVLFYFKVGYITAIVGIITSIALVMILDTKMPKAFASFRNYTYQIYIMGIFFQILVKILYKQFLAPDWYLTAYLLCVLTGLYCPVIISKIAEIIGWNPIFYLLGLNSKNKTSR